MGMDAVCFLIEPTGRTRRWLRRYSTRGAPGICPADPGDYSYHHALVLLDEVDDTKLAVQIPQSDPRWPKRCTCGYEFGATDTWQHFPRMLYKRGDTDEVYTLDDAPPGAMYFSDWMVHSESQNWYRGPDGHCLSIKGFYGDTFCPDARASNCDKKDDDAHKCWVRTGDAPKITISKIGGPTCGAGAGSFYFGKIKQPDGSYQYRWHGFLENGVLVQR